MEVWQDPTANTPPAEPAHPQTPQRSYGPWRPVWRLTWSSWTPHRPTRTPGSLHWTPSSGRRGRQPLHLWMWRVWKGREIGRGLSSRTIEERKKGGQNAREALIRPLSSPLWSSSTSSWGLSSLKPTGTLRGELCSSLEDHRDVPKKWLGCHRNNDSGKAWSLLISPQWSLPVP